MKSRYLVLALVAVVLALAAAPVYAHGFGPRYSLPLPLNYFLVGAGATVALSFVVIGLFVNAGEGEFRYPQLDLLKVGVIGPVLRSTIVLTIVKVVSVAIFVLLLATSLFGANRPIENFSPTFVWIIWWVGIGYISALIGNLWMLVNPWKIVYEWAEKLLGGSGDGLFDYPEGWDVWPAVTLFLVFAWLENVYASATIPFNLGLLILGYSAITWGGMLAFGKHTWLVHGEAFSVLFGFFARFSPTEVRVLSGDDDCVDCYEEFEAARPEQRQLNLRPYAVGLATTRPVSTATAAFVILALATVTFDGLVETTVWDGVQRAVLPAFEFLGTSAAEFVDTAGLIVMPLVFLTVFLGFSWAIKGLGRESATVSAVAKAFVFSLVPIALAYNVAHFLSLLAVQGQLIIPLLSDPFGFDWDLFGTSGYRLKLDVLSSGFVWFASVGVIVVGHVVSVYIAHVISLQRLNDRAAALRSQYPMLVLMVLYTATSLWIIAQPIVDQG